ncbi:MAG: hypothetical protein JO138_15575 [Acidobacteriaceae bacterium]|nr:hypothetical protein [Acidobacteriaceae bacterium]
MAKRKPTSVGSVSASEFRAHLFTHLGTAAKGHPVQIEYKGSHYQLVAVKPEGKFEKFFASGPPEPVIHPSDEWFSDDPSLKRQREEEWIAKWDKRLNRK